jgi:hypothetical protein
MLFDKEGLQTRSRRFSEVVKNELRGSGSAFPIVHSFLV